MMVERGRLERSPTQEEALPKRPAIRAALMILGERLVALKGVLFPAH